MDKIQKFFLIAYCTLSMLCVISMGITQEAKREINKKQIEKLESQIIEQEILIDNLYSTIEYMQKENTELKNTILENECNDCIHEQEMIEILKNYDLKQYYIEYINIINKYSDYTGVPESVYDFLTEDEIYLFQRCVETETFECPFESKVNVANVILNRLNSEEFPNSITKVITSPNQFAYCKTEISEDTKLAIEYAFMFEDTTNGALFFHSNNKSDNWNGREYIFTDKSGHHFY